MTSLGADPFEVLKFAWEQLDKVTSGRARGVGAVAARAIPPDALQGPMRTWCPELGAGTLKVNGKEVPVDPERNVFDLVDAIDGCGGGVTAAVHGDTGRVRLCPRERGGRVALDGGGTGFFSGLGIAEGTYVAVMEPARALDRAARALAQLAERLEGELSHEDVRATLGDHGVGVRAGLPGEPLIVVDRIRLSSVFRSDLEGLRQWVVGSDDVLAPLEQLAARMDERLA
jgi:hypothetical protein